MPVDRAEQFWRCFPQYARTCIPGCQRPVMVDAVPPPRERYTMSATKLCSLVSPSFPCASCRRVDPTRRVQRVRLFLCSFVLYMPWIPGEHCRGICAVECATAHLRWFEEDLGSEVVFWIEAPVSCQQLESDFWSQS